MKKSYIFFLPLLLSASLPAQKLAAVSSLKQASVEQQKAIAQLVRAQKEVRKIILAASEQSKKENAAKAESAFKDNQEYQHASPEKKLGELQKQQQEISEKLAAENGEPGENDSSGTSSATLEKLQQKQQQISEELQALQQNISGDSSMRQSMEAAQQSSRKTGQALKEAAIPEARVGAQKTKEKIGQALQELRKTAAAKSENALETAEKQLNDAARALRNQDRKQVEEQAEAAQNTLEKARQEQQQSGTEEEEEKLARLTKKMEPGWLDIPLSQNPQAAAQKLEEMKAAIASARQEDRSDFDVMKESIQKLEELEKEFEYIAHSGKEPGNKTLSDRLAEIEMLIQQINRIEKQPQAGTPHPSAAHSNAATQSAIDALISQGEAQTIAPVDVAFRAIELVDEVLIKARQQLALLEQPTVIRDVAQDQVPKKYQEDVAAYFERLSQTDRRP